MMLFKLAWRNVFRNKRRTLITMAMVALAVFLAICMRSMQLGTYDQMIDGLVKYSTGYVRVSPVDYQTDPDINNPMVAANALPQNTSTIGIKAASNRVETMMYASCHGQGAPVQILGIDVETESDLLGFTENLVDGEHLNANDHAIYIGTGLAKKMELEVGDSLIVQGQGYRGSIAVDKLPIKGIIKINNPVVSEMLVYAPISVVRKILDLPNEFASYQAIHLKKASKMKTVQQNLKNQLDTIKVDVMNWQEMNPELYQGIQGDAVGGLVIVSILYLIIAFGIFSTILMMTTERQYEFGVLLSIGMKRLKLGFMVILEILFICLMGLVLGALLAFPLVYYVHLNPIEFGGQAAASMKDMGFEPAMFTTIDFNVTLTQALLWC
ncbi:MAG: ABC transporter permease [Bacteroidetes bacterium]|nr:ABC transporter permease [Bacteroidota bacterium]